MLQATIGLFILSAIGVFFAILSSRNLKRQSKNAVKQMKSEVKLSTSDSNILQGNQPNSEAMKMAASGNAQSSLTTSAGR
jgi:hypothetical protein